MLLNRHNCRYTYIEAKELVLLKLCLWIKQAAQKGSCSNDSQCRNGPFLSICKCGYESQKDLHYYSFTDFLCVAAEEKYLNLNNIFSHLTAWLLNMVQALDFGAGMSFTC